MRVETNEPFKETIASPGMIAGWPGMRRDTADREGKRNSEGAMLRIEPLLGELAGDKPKEKEARHYEELDRRNLHDLYEELFKDGGNGEGSTSSGR